MNAEILAEWFRRQGFHVVRTDSSYWFSQGYCVYQAFPYHWVISPSRRELSGFMLRHGAIGARYSTPLDAPSGSVSYHCVYSGGAYDLVDLPRRARGAVRKGLRNATVEQISLDTLSEDGWLLRLDTMQRQGRENSEPESWWKRMCQTGKDLPGVEAWGAFCRGHLVAAILAIVCEDCYTLLYQQSATDYLNSGINNALAYVVTHQAMAREDISQVFYGLESLNASEEVDVFKVRMGYTARCLRQRVVFHPVIEPFAGLVGYRALPYLVNRYPDRTTFTKIQGMFRFYDNGRLPLDRQRYPAVLSTTQTDSESDAAGLETANEPV
jgi:hypothetical protein